MEEKSRDMSKEAKYQTQLLENEVISEMTQGNLCVDFTRPTSVASLKNTRIFQSFEILFWKILPSNLTK
jgi:hypothetical protein